MLAKKLHDMASANSKSTANDLANKYYEDLVPKLAKRAKSGKFELEIPTSTVRLSKESIEILFSLLEKEGFSVSTDYRITSQYSNTDFDSEYFILIKW